MTDDVYETQERKGNGGSSTFFTSSEGQELFLGYRSTMLLYATDLAAEAIPEVKAQETSTSMPALKHCHDGFRGKGGVCRC
jgi:hypothetical protein